MNENQTHDPTPWALSLTDAARMVGMSKTHFRRVFIDGGRVHPIPSGERDRIIDTTELRSAYEKFIAEKRATN